MSSNSTEMIGDGEAVFETTSAAAVGRISSSVVTLEPRPSAAELPGSGVKNSKINRNLPDHAPVEGTGSGGSEREGSFAESEESDGKKKSKCSKAALCERFDGHCHELCECGLCLADCGRETWTGLRTIDCRAFLRRTFTVNTLKDKLPILKWLPKYR